MKRSEMTFNQFKKEIKKVEKQLLQNGYVVYREFPDGEDEIGILTFESGHFWAHVGDFDYCLTIYKTDYPFQIIGEL